MTMSTTEYVNRLMQSRTFKTGVIEDIEEYKLQSRLYVFKTLPSLPQANDDRHVIVIEVRGNHPSVFSVLSKPNHTINPTARDIDKLVFVFLSMKPQQLKISSPLDEYQLGDGQQVNTDFEIIFRVTDADEFWRAAKDPIAIIESEVVNEARSYFLKLDTNSLIDYPLPSHEKLEQQILESQMSVIKEGLSSVIRQISIRGMQIVRVHAHITLSKPIKDIVDGWHTPDGEITRRRLDARIDRDQTFAPYKLRDVVMMFDNRLLENFYSLPYGEAMKLVHETVRKAKDIFMEQLRANQLKEINQLSSFIRIAKENGLDETHIFDLQEKMGEKLKQMANTSTNILSDQEFVKWRLDNKLYGQLTDNSTARSSPEVAKDNQKV
jgi:hypothetical protein